MKAAAAKPRTREKEPAEGEAPRTIHRRRTPALDGLAYENTLDLVIHNIARMQRTRFGQLAKALGLTRSQWQVLNRLSLNKGISLSALAEMLEVELITAGRLIDSLEELGWAERRPSPTDRRVKLVFMLDAASKVQVKMHKIAKQLHDECFETISKEDYKALDRLLNKVYASIASKI